MDIGSILGIVLPIVYIVVGVVLVWFVIELALTIRRTRSTVDSVHEQIGPTIEHVNEIAKGIEPVVAKADPLMDRVALTVDAANLEIMRVDQILEDVSQMTGTVTKTLDTVDSVTSLPLDAVNSLTTKVRSIFKKPQASEQSQRLGEERAAENAASLKADPDEPAMPSDRQVELPTDQKPSADQIERARADAEGAEERIIDEHPAGDDPAEGTSAEAEHDGSYVKAEEPDRN